jgi:serine protease Do
VYAGCRGTYRWLPTGKSFPQSTWGTGSGFFINPIGYIATNAHVTEAVKNPDTCEKDLFDDFVVDLADETGVKLRSMTSAERTAFVQEARRSARLSGFEPIAFVRLPNGTDLNFEIKAYGAPVGEGKDVSIIKVETRNAPVIKIADSDKVRLQEHVTVAGYPGAADTKQTGLLSRASALEASFTDGRVSARKTAADGSPVLQISAPATHGNSGGPVLNDAGEVIGLLTFGGDTVNRQEVQGFTFVVASNTVMEFIRQVGTKNEDGPVDKAYREGLDLFWAARYTPAIAKFEEIRRLFPQHSEAERLIRESQEAITAGKEVQDAPPHADMAPAGEEKGSGPLDNPLVLGGSALAVVAAAAGGAIALRRRTHRPPLRVVQRGAADSRRPPQIVEGSVAYWCDKCGAQLRPGAKFCPGCGTRRHMA